MRQPDRPEAGRPDGDSQAGGRGHAADLAARLLRLPAGHPSGDRATSGAARDSRSGSAQSPAGRPEEEPERENWWERGPEREEPGPDDWRSGLKYWRSRPDPDGSDTGSWPDEWKGSGPGAREDPGPGTVPDSEPGERPGGTADGGEATGPDDDMAGESGRRAGGGRGWLEERGGGPVGAPAHAVGGGPYRPWFAGDWVQPWFAADSDGLLGGSRSLLAGADGLLSEPDDPDNGRGTATPGG